MKKILCLIFISLFCFTSCDDYKFSSSSNLAIIETSTNSNTNTNDCNNSVDDENTAINLYDDNKHIESFVYHKNFYRVNDYIYYLSTSDKFLRKCKKDLSDDIILEKNVIEFYIQNSTLYYLICSNDTNQIFKIDLNNEEFNREKISEFNGLINNVVFFRDNIFYKSYEESTYKLKAYNISQNASRIIVNEKINDFSIIDNCIYYNKNNENYIYKYDISTEKINVVYEFLNQNSFSPKIYYIERMIVIQINENSFICININDMSSKNISFDISEYERGWVSLSFFDKDNLYFSISEHYDVSNPTTTLRSIYKVEFDADKPEFIKNVIGDSVRCLIDNNLYFFDNNNNIVKEEFIQY